jgi:hypothetical protein
MIFLLLYAELEQSKAIVTFFNFFETKFQFLCDNYFIMLYQVHMQTQFALRSF